MLVEINRVTVCYNKCTCIKIKLTFVLLNLDILFLETTDQLIRIHSFAFSLRSCQNLAIFAQQYRVKQFKFDSLCRIVVFFVVCVHILYFEGLMEDKLYH